MNTFLKEFDTILNDILTDYFNLDSKPDISVGGMPYIQASAASSAIWGLYKAIDFVMKQHFPDTANAQYNRRWASVLGITILSTDTDATIKAKVLSKFRQPPAGGNNLDYQTWAKDATNAYYTDPALGTTYYNKYCTVVDTPGSIAGTVGVYTIPDDETIVNNGANTFEEDLRLATAAYIETVRPLGLLSVSVFSSDFVETDVTIAVAAPVGGTVDTDAIAAAITANMNTMVPGESLWNSTLSFLCHAYGAASAVISEPATDETSVENDEYIRSGTILIT